MTQTYTTRHNCIRAARTALQKLGVTEPMSLVHFRVGGADGAYTWDRIDQVTGEATPAPVEDAPVAPVPEGFAAAMALLTAQPAVTICPTMPAGGVSAPRRSPSRLKVSAAAGDAAKTITFFNLAGEPVEIPNSTKPAELVRRRLFATKAQAVAAGKRVAEAAAAKAAAPATQAQRAERVGKRAAVVAAAASGELPEAPIFPEHATWNSCRKRMEAIAPLVAAGDVDGLRALSIPTYDSGVKKIATYRDLVVAALVARAAAQA